MAKQRERLIDLNGRDGCSVAVITIQDKTYRISRIVVAARLMYSNYLSTISKLLNEYADTAGAADNKQIQGLYDKYTEYAEKVPDILLGIIQLLLEKNGYEYSEEWWKENSDIEDMRGFIDAALSKDSDTVKKK